MTVNEFVHLLKNSPPNANVGIFYVGYGDNLYAINAEKDAFGLMWVDEKTGDCWESFANFKNANLNNLPPTSLDKYWNENIKPTVGLTLNLNKRKCENYNDL